MHLSLVHLRGLFPVVTRILSFQIPTNMQYPTYTVPIWSSFLIWLVLQVCKLSIVSPPVQSPYLQICLLTKMYCNPEISVSSAVTVICRQAQSGENLEWLNAYFPAEVGRQCSAFLFQLSYCKQVSFSWPI